MSSTELRKAGKNNVSARAAGLVDSSNGGTDLEAALSDMAAKATVVNTAADIEQTIEN